MSMVSLLQSLKADNIELKLADNHKLLVTGPELVLTDVVLKTILNCKNDLIKLLQSEQQLNSLRGDHYIASAGQKRLWFLDKIHPFSPAYNISFAITFYGELDADRLEKACMVIIENHLAFRTYFAWANDTLIAKIDRDWKPFLPVINISAKSSDEKLIIFNDRCDKISAFGFDLSCCPLWRWELVKLNAFEHVMIFSLHHAICDGWSMVRTLSEFAFSYDNDLPHFKPLSASQYKDYANWQAAWIHTDSAREEISYWKGILSQHVNPVGLPVDKPRPPVQSDMGGRISRTLSRDLEQALRKLQTELGVSIPTMIFCLWAVFITRISGNTRFFLGSAISNRIRQEFDDVVGFFVNWLPILVDCSDMPSFSEFTSRCNRTLQQAYKHQNLPFDNIVQLSGETGNLSQHPLFQTMVVCHVPARRIKLNDLKCKISPLSTQSSKLDLTIFVTDTRNAISISDIGDLHFEFEYSADLFEERTIRAWIESFLTLTEEVVAAPVKRIDQYGLVKPAEQSPLLQLPSESMHQLFQRQVGVNPTNIAIIDDGVKYTYEDLNRWSDHIHNLMKPFQPQKKTRIAVIANRSAAFVASIIALLKSGTCFVPIDLNYPASRIQFMLEDSEAALILGDSDNGSCNSDLPFISIPQFNDTPSVIESSEATQTAADDEMYIFYTSGSTGKPKGVICRTGSVVNFASWLNKHSKIAARDRVLFRASICFDASIREYLVPLTGGATVVIAKEEVSKNIDSLALLCANEKITVLHAVPTVYGELLHSKTFDSTSLRQVYSGGEILTATLVKLHYSLSDANLTNLYGPTESTIDVTAGDCTPKHIPQRIPIGKPIDGVIIRILDKNMNPLPIGVTGDIYIGGVCLAKGYTDEELTKQYFINDPFLPGRKLYCTGDIGRLGHDDNVIFEGRRDRQIKLRGHRIEPGEIEYTIQKHKSIEKCIVLKTQLSNSAILTACVTVKNKNLTIEDKGTLTAQLFFHCMENLPSFNIPSKIVIMDAFPKLSTGKTDLTVLNELVNEQSGTSYIGSQPQSEMEKLVAAGFEKILNVDKLALSADFFHLGGHSLSATQLAAYIKEGTGCAFTLRDIFQCRTIDAIAKKIATMSVNAGNTPDVIIPINRPRKNQAVQDTHYAG